LTQQCPSRLILASCKAGGVTKPNEDPTHLHLHCHHDHNQPPPQLALISQPPGKQLSNTLVIVMLLADCLQYSNSAMNPVLYAFLSENFKKSFQKVKFLPNLQTIMTICLPGLPL
jgi:hypothetical protein